MTCSIYSKLSDPSYCPETIRVSADARAKCRAEGYCDAATFIRAARAAGRVPSKDSATPILISMFAAIAFGFVIASAPFAFGDPDGEGILPRSSASKFPQDTASGN